MADSQFNGALYVKEPTPQERVKGATKVVDNLSNRLLAQTMFALTN